MNYISLICIYHITFLYPCQYSFHHFHHSILNVDISLYIWYNSLLKEVKSMLPMKLELTEKLAATLRQLRLDHPVDGEILTAENLSKAIGNNRAWMSQIESRRLKKIRREDIIKIYKLLYNEENDYQAEYRAEIGLMEFLFENKGENSEFITGGSISNAYSDDAYNEYRLKHDGINYTNEDLIFEKQRLMEIANDLVNNFMEHLKEYPSSLEHSNYINKLAELEDKLNVRFEDTLYIMTELDLHALQYATEDQHKSFIESIDKVACDLGKISSKHDFETFVTNVEAAKNILSDYQNYKETFPEDELLRAVTKLLVSLSAYVSSNNWMTIEEKISYTNDLIFIVYHCSIVVKNKQLFDIKDLSKNATIDDIYAKINQLQIFLSNFEDNPVVIMGQISKYFTT